ncbi:MAG TPA: AGE family epimerase/isomerase [Sphingomonas sp.]|nr:AGE family epimerase/isomerase [Sphingomonas sp.]
MTVMLRAYIDWIATSALPFWAERGFDAAGGRFHERLDRNGDPIAVPHRAMVQARQIFVFAHAAELGWSPAGARLAEVAMASLLRDFADHGPDETCFAFSIDPASGGTISPVRDAYAHAFVLLSIATLYRLNGDRHLIEIADRTIRFIERRLGDPVYGGLFDALPAPAGKRQNPHMHLLEAYLALEHAAPGRGYIERAAGLIDLFRRHFLADGVLREYFERDWTAAEPAIWEPGHHFEWVWLLGEYATLTGEDLSAAADDLYRSAIVHGVASDDMIVDQVATHDRAVIKPSCRVWPHIEAIKAAATREGAGDPAARPFAESMAARLLGTFLDRPFAGGWIDHVAADAAPLVEHVPASTLYHLMLGGSVAAKGFASGPALAKADS